MSITQGTCLRVHSHEKLSPTGYDWECTDCGSLCCYADDSTLTISGPDPETVSHQIGEKYKALDTFMLNNRLVLNSDKTHLLVLSSPHRHRKFDNFNVSLNTGNEIILPQESEDLLGTTLSNNFMWNLYLRDGEKSLLKTLCMKNNALERLSHIADFKTRKMIASGLIMSSVSYIIQVYGGCSGYLLDMLQVQQNLAARRTTKLPRLTPTKTLLEQCNWLSIRQLIKFQSLVLFHKTLIKMNPIYLYSQVRFVDRETRTLDRLNVIDRKNRRFKTVTASKGFFPRTIKDWNSLPFVLRDIKDIQHFKAELKSYIKDKIPVK